MDLFSQVKFCSKCGVGVRVGVTAMVVESGDKFKVVGHETQFVLVEDAMVLRLEYHDEQRR